VGKGAASARGANKAIRDTTRAATASIATGVPYRKDLVTTPVREGDVGVARDCTVVLPGGCAGWDREYSDVDMGAPFLSGVGHG